MISILALVLLASAFAATCTQQPFSTPWPSDAETDEYLFKWPIRKVAIIGAGPSGLTAYRELAEAGLDVRIFERDSVPGGNWHYTEEAPLDAPVPNVPCSVGDFVPSFPPANVVLPYSEEIVDGGGEVGRAHWAPRPIWDSLTSNAPSALQQFHRWPWPAGTRWELTQYQLRNYIRSYASYLHINSNDDNPATAYNTRVELVEKRIDEAGEERGWRLWLKSLGSIQSYTYNATWWTEDFDAVVVASGRYNAPSMPSIPGLQEWVQKFPDLISHSRQYRRPEVYANQTVLIIGASFSGSEISRDLNHHARRVYQSLRPTNDSVALAKLQRAMHRMPRNSTLVGEIKQFLPIPEGSPIQSGFIELKNGTILSGFDRLILATGFRYSYPFLSQYYDGATYQPHAGSAQTVSSFLPLSGTYIRDLYLDMFYIRDPTLAFLSVSFGARAQSFLMIDYTTLALAKVWTNVAKLPDGQTMQVVYEKTVEERGGYGKYTLFCTLDQCKAAIQYMVGWLNEAAVKYGGKQIDAMPKEYDEVRIYWDIAHFGASVQQNSSKADADFGGVQASLGLGLGRSEDDLEDWFYGNVDDW